MLLFYFKSESKQIFVPMVWRVERRLHLTYKCLLRVTKNPAGIYLFKFDNGNTKTVCDYVFKVNSTPETRQLHRPNFFLAIFLAIVNEIVLESLLLYLNRFHTLLGCFHCCA